MFAPVVPAGVLGVVSVLLVVGLVLVAAWLGWQEYRAQRGNDIHAHADGTVHEHFRGSAPHAHPTAIERYDSWLTRVLGPAEADRVPDAPPQGRRRCHARLG